MKTRFQHQLDRAGRRLALAVLLAGVATFGLAAEDAPAPAPAPPATPPPAAASATPLPAFSHYSGGIYDVLKLADAKVGDAVIIAYVEASPISYQPTAQEVVTLKEHGVSDNAIRAILNHGGEMRARQPMAAQQPVMPVSPAPSVAAAAPAYNYAYPSAGYTYPDYGYYGGYPYYSYYYPYYYGGVSVYWPWWGWGGYYRGWGGYRGGVGFHGGVGYHGGGVVHGGGGFHGGGGHGGHR